MKTSLSFAFVGILSLLLFTGSSTGDDPDCTYDKDSMRVVMRFEIKVKAEGVAFLKQSFDACKAEVLAKEPGCLDYSLFQSTMTVLYFALRKPGPPRLIMTRICSLNIPKSILRRPGSFAILLFKRTATMSTGSVRV